MWELVVIFLLTLFVYHCWNLRPPNFPPGPTILPLVGSVPFLELLNLHLYLEKAREKYGPIIGAKLGMRNTVFFCSPKHVMEVYKIDEIQGRPPNIALASNTAVNGILLTDGPFWTTQRRFTIRHLRDFGFGKTSTEGVMMEEIDEFFEQSLNNKNKVQTTNLFNTSAINVLWRLMAGKRYRHDDESFKVLLEALYDTFRDGGFTNKWVFLRRFFRSLLNIPEKIGCEETLINFIKNSIEDHKKDPADEPRDFIDVYLREIERAKDPNFTELSLLSVCIDLFIAGAESIGNTLSFMLLYLVLHPEIQEDIWREIDSNLCGRKPQLSDEKSLPKLEAFLSEVIRINTIAPAPIPRRATKDVEYAGYTIPKDTFVVMSLWSVFQDKEHWGDPEVFRPSRFLDNQGKFVKDDWLINFGLGKRQCPAEALSRNIIFLFLVRLIQEFKYSLPVGAPTPSTKAMAGFTTTPEPFEVQLTRRS